MNDQDFIPIKKKKVEDNQNLSNTNSQSLNNNQDLIYFANSLSGNNIDKKISENDSNSNNNKIENQSNLNELNNFQELKEELATQPVNNLHTNPDSIFNNKQDNLNNQLNDSQIESFNMKNNFDNLNISNSNQEQSNNSNNNLADNEILKVAKTLKNDMLIIGILYVIVIIGLIFFKSFALDNIMTIISLIFVVITYLGASDKEWYAGRLGLIIGILMTL